MKSSNQASLNQLLNSYGYLFFFVIIAIAGSIFTPNFISLNTLRNVLVQMTPVLITGLAMTIAISSGGLDISIGSIMAVSSMCCAKTLSIGILPAIVIGITVGIFFGFVNGFIISRFKVEPIIITLATMIAGRGIAQVLNEGKVFIFYEPQFTDWAFIRIGNIIPIQVLVMLIAILIIWFLVRRTVFGVYVQALGDNVKAAGIAGINTYAITLVVYVICGIMAGVSGIMETSRLTIADASQVGLGIEMDAIAAVALGGTPLTGGVANIFGTVIGCMTIQMITVIINMNNLSTAYAYLMKGIVLILAICIQNLDVRGR